MKNKSIVAVVGALLLLGGLAFVLSTQSSDTTSNQTSTTQTNSTNPSGAGGQNTTDSAIEDYLSQANDGGEQDATSQDQVDITIDSFVFEPTRLTVVAGTTVTWTNTDSIRHNVVSWQESPNTGLDSELLDNGESYSFTFDEPGEYVYFCEPHPFRMRGVVTVVEG